MRHTTPPLPPLSSATRFRKNSPVRRSQILTVPSSDDVTTKRRLNWRHVTALWCLLAPTQACWRFITSTTSAKMIHWAIISTSTAVFLFLHTGGLPVTWPTASKHWREAKALTTTRETGRVASPFLIYHQTLASRGTALVKASSPKSIPKQYCYGSRVLTVRQF